MLYALLGLYKLVGILFLPFSVSISTEDSRNLISVAESDFYRRQDVLYGTVLAILTLSPYPGLVACTVWDVCIVPRLYPVDGSERCGQYA